MSKRLLDEINEIVNDIERYWINEKLAKQVIIEDLRNNDKNLISKLLSNQTINETYVQDINGYKIFDKEAFISMLRYKNYWQDSYTKYTNKIGLTSEGKYLNYNSDIVLDFPFKDCLLKAGMTNESNLFNNDEKFYNQVIAKEEIDTLLSPKTLTKIKRYSEEGENEISKFKDDDNLIIKGNNIIVLYSIKERYKGKVKLIYIDPPYNTGNDSFQYNDRFNHASWLTFMKNRLEVAKELLSEDGVICIQCDDNENAYLKVLLDEIFGINNFVNNVAIKMSEASGIKLTHSQKKLPKIKENIFIYKKDKVNLNPIKVLKNQWDKEYNKIFENFTKEDKKLIDSINDKKLIDDEDLNQIDEILKNVKISSINNFTKNLNKDQKQKWLLENSYRIFRTAASKSVKNLVDEKKVTTDQTYISVKSKTGNIYIGKSDYESTSKSPRVQIIFSEDNLMYTLGDVWTDINTTGLEVEGNVLLKNGKKPEKLIKRIIEFSTKERDLVLDFFMGSGTTQAVAHKMNRQYIGIEQMDYINSISVPRLQKVIDGEKSGVSKDVDWQGGGSFVYAELAKENQAILDRIISSSTKEELSQQIDKLLNDGVLNYEVDFDKFTSTKKEFHELELEDQKEVLIRVLDSNELYVNYTEIEDSEYNFTEDEIAFNHSFYGGE
ncbi:site-specific DNA-methyltransferase [Staphylococcus epidermidis]|uniref:DNA methyltransferase n=1 Tax=Staphylococcus epidermidis TaxID=1282 RepID=UPI0013687C37|nr:site-specific DNA-methyltransferase [Staphylococcus epidermidis]NAN39860.1 site-specific DNA-methyltransferase [Staphylococcus epidermidis]